MPVSIPRCIPESPSWPGRVTLPLVSALAWSSLVVSMNTGQGRALGCMRGMLESASVSLLEPIVAFSGILQPT